MNRVLALAALLILRPLAAGAQEAAAPDAAWGGSPRGRASGALSGETLAAPEPSGPVAAWSLAAKAYDAGDYKRAAAIYGRLLDDDPNNASLHYNLGSALFRAGKVGRSIAQYQRAFDIMPRDPDIRYNLAFALKRAGEDLVPVGVPPLLHRAFYWLSDRELAGLHWLACWTTLLLASLFLLRESLRPVLIPWTAGAIASWLFFGGWWGARRLAEPSERAVIVQSAAEIRSGPGENYSVSFTVPEGRRVEVLGVNGQWTETGLAKEGVKGWILSESLERIE
ncbi:MAG: tetratricopeptide repeat protein [Elusimicrobia bacterium]|nr:tetratricopeptide repeat protein [Elusimicrobiota bacterium]